MTNNAIKNVKKIFNKKVEEYKQQASRERELRREIQDAARKERQKQSMKTAIYRERLRAKQERKRISSPPKQTSFGLGGDFFGSSQSYGGKKKKSKPINISDFKLPWN